MEVDTEIVLPSLKPCHSNSYILLLLSSCGDKKILHTDFRWSIVRNLLAQAGQEWHVQRPVGRPAAEVLREEISVSKHWPILSATHGRCYMCSARGVNGKVSVKCWCDVTLYVDRKSFLDYHTRANLWHFSGCSTGPPYTKLGPQLGM